MVDPSYAPGVRVLRVPDGPTGRVDRYVADATGMSRSYVQKLISDGRLTASGEALRSNAKSLPNSSGSAIGSCPSRAQIRTVRSEPPLKVTGRPSGNAPTATE